MYNPDAEPDIFGGEDTDDSAEATESFQEAQTDLTELDDEHFQYRYKASKEQYQIILKSMRQLHETYAALQEMSALSIDPDVADNTKLLIEDYTNLLEQMHMASYWEREGH